MDDYYEHHRGSVHRGVYPLAVEATELFEGAPRRIAADGSAGTAPTTIFTRNATEALNLVAYAWGRANVGPGDRVVVTQMEHHSNLVPWWMLVPAKGAMFEVVPVDDEGELVLDPSSTRCSPRGDVKVVAVGHVSNVLGTINPVAEIVRRARAAGAVVVVDGSQAVPQMPVDLRRDRRRLLRLDRAQGLRPDRHRRPARAPRAARGDAAVPRRRAHDRVGAVDEIRWGELPGEVRGRHVGDRRGDRARRRRRLPRGHRHGAIRAHERDLCAYALERLAEVPGHDASRARSTPTAAARSISFALDVAHPHDVAEILGASGVCVRAGHHCAQPLMKRFGAAATSRARSPCTTPAPTSTG